ncbi:hypothetical protein Afil01_42000 [Actinorhabdospora filicis]|uniref:Type II toxin-antitoxin system PemK/MazF family toxin n=2 Tax=Actinorhabdospora filicis TaxID=1785913 RepID=A0A9W6SNU1_9ACTN|nr:hypothetical protein Afil01_42000 [Actinorhabdospora filicis]
MPGVWGREQQGPRPAVIIQSDSFATSVVTVAITSASAAPAIYRPEIEIDGHRTRVLTDQIYSVSPDRFGKFKGALDPAEIMALDSALLLKLGLM